MGRCDLRNRLRGTIWYHLESSLPRADLEVGALGEANIPITNSPPLWLTAWSHGPAENGQIVRESGLSKVQPNRFMADQTPRRTPERSVDWLAQTDPRDTVQEHLGCVVRPDAQLTR